MRYQVLAAILFSFFFYTSGAQTDSSSTKLNVQSILNHLEQRDQLRFSYNHDAVKLLSIAIDTAGAYLEIITILSGALDLKIENVKDNYYTITVLDLSVPSIEKISISGIVSDSTNGQPLVAATISIANSYVGITTNDSGRFHLKGDYNIYDFVEFRYVGYKLISVRIDKLMAVDSVAIVLAPNSHLLGGFDVVEYLAKGIDKNQFDQSIRITPSTVNMIPGESEQDVLKVILMLPGINSVDETASGIYLRGGTPDQNLILWDDIPVYQSGHYFGLISAFNPNSIEEIDVYRGAVNAEFGGRVAGLINMKSTRNLSDSLIVGMASTMTHGNIYAQIPLIPGRVGVMISGRTSYFNRFNSPTYQKYSQRIFQQTKIKRHENDTLDAIDVLQNSFTFHDVNAVVELKPSDKDDFRFSYLEIDNKLGYSTNDPFLSQRATDDLVMRNDGWSSNWIHQWTDKLTTNLSSSNSDYRYSYFFRQVSTTNTDSIISAISKYNQIRDLNYKLSFWYQVDPTFAFIGGGNYQKLNLAYSNNAWNSIDTVYNESLSNELEVYSGFAKIKGYIGDLQFQIGARTNYIPRLNTINFEPRANIGFKFSPYFTLTGSVDFHHQYLSQLVEWEDNDLGIQDPIWVIADNKNIETIQGVQYTAGGSYTRNGWFVDLDIYQKKLTDISAYSRSFINIADVFHSGDIQTDGLDFMIKKDFKNYRTWMSYTLSQSNYIFEEFSSKPFPASHDQTHSLSWIHQVEWKNFIFSLGWRYKTGQPYTAIRSAIVTIQLDQFNEVASSQLTPIWDTPNSSRYTDYHRLDLSIGYEITPFLKYFNYGKIGISLINVYNQQNILDKQFGIVIYDFDPVDAYISETNRYKLGITPNVYVHVEF